MSPEKKLGTTALTGRNGILNRYFYFAMSLLLAAIVVIGFKRTVNANLFHPAVPRLAHPLLQELRVPHPFASCAKGRVFPSPKQQQKRPCKLCPWNPTLAKSARMAHPASRV